MIKNITKDKIIASSFEDCRTWWQQTRGLMFRKEIIPLVFTFGKPKRIALHSYFVKEPIDLVFLNDAWEVVELVSEWTPRNTFKSEREAMFLMELPMGTIEKSETEVGDVVHLMR